MSHMSIPTFKPTASWADPRRIRLDFWLFVIMLALALAGVALTQLDLSSTSLYWALLALVYGGISVARARIHAKGTEQPFWPTVRDAVLHWIGTLLAIKVVLFFELSGIADRGPASDYSLLLLALSCYLAGVHLDWIFLPLGVALAVIAVGIGYLDQLSLLALAVPVSVLALWIVFKQKWVRMA
jgi:hypothetical protein